MPDYFGIEFLYSLQSYYGQRLALAHERGNDHASCKYYWLYKELDHRVSSIRRAMLFLDALPRFMLESDSEGFLSYVARYFSQTFSDPALGSIHEGTDPHPLFNSDNPYWADLQSAWATFGDGYDLSLLPLTYIDLCEFVICTLRLYLQMRERICSIDRGKFDEVMHMRPRLASSA